MNPPRLRTLSTTFFALILFTAIGATGLQAQSPGPGYVRGYAPAWSGYAPGSAWSSYNPNNVMPATRSVTTPGSAWSGYAPATPWQRYNSESGWRTNTPGRVVLTPATPPRSTTAPRSTRSAGGFKSSTYREYGTGRNVFMHKPWLPNQP